jgi:hypothetical protein
MAGYSNNVATTMLCSRRASSDKVYLPHIKRWQEFCATQHYDDIRTTVPRILTFLQTLIDAKFSYSSINSAKAAISTCVTLPQGQQLGTDPDIKTFMRRAFNIRPPVTKRTHVWDPETVLRYMKSREPCINRCPYMFCQILKHSRRSTHIRKLSNYML